MVFVFNIVVVMVTLKSIIQRVSASQLPLNYVYVEADVRIKVVKTRVFLPQTEMGC